MEVYERPAGRLEHLVKIEVQNMCADETGQPVDQVFLGIAITVGLRNGRGVRGGVLGGPLDPDAGHQLIRVSRVQHPVHCVYQLTVAVICRRYHRRPGGRGRWLVGSGDGHGAAERKGHRQNGSASVPIHRGVEYVSLLLCQCRRCSHCRTEDRLKWLAGQATDVVMSSSAAPFPRCLFEVSG